MTGPRTTILVVDDDPILLRVMYERLTRAGYDVSTRAEALGTCEWIVRSRPDLVLLDVGMPALSGAALAKLLRRKGLARYTGVVLHSGMSRGQLDQLVIATGALGAIQKTGDETWFLRELAALVAELFRRRQPIPPAI